MDFKYQFHKFCRLKKWKWLLVVIVVAITHLFCQSVMLPKGKALVSLLPGADTNIHEPLKLGHEPSTDQPPYFADAPLLLLSVKRVAHTSMAEAAPEGKEDDNVDFVDQTGGDSDMPFEEHGDEGILLERSIENRNALSLQQVVMSSNSSRQSDGMIKNDHGVTLDEAIMSKLHSPPTLFGVESGEASSGIGYLRNCSSSKPVKKKMRCNMPPKTVTLINEMDSLLVRHRAHSRSMKPRWSSERDKEILNAKFQIENAPLINSDKELYSPIFRNLSMFKRSYEIMERTLKVYVYRDGEKPIFHQPVLKGLYASEGWFMKLMEGNKQYTIRDPRRAHLYYMPFSSRMLEHSLYVRNSHNRTNLRQYLKDYSEKIAAKYNFWNRTGGADHFLVACHDWAPYETRHHMEHCIKSLCNADVTVGFKIGRDVSLPETYVRSARNPLRDIGGKTPSQRHILAFYAGSLHGYLRPILLDNWNNKDPDMKIFGPMPRGVESKMNYIQHMKSSKYCICPKGYEVNSPRVVEAIFYECVPVIISDNFVPPFFEVLNWNAFSIILAEKDIPNLKEILVSMSEERYLELQLGVRKVQKHFLWHPKPLKYDLFHMTLYSIWYNRVFQIKLR